MIEVFASSSSRTTSSNFGISSQTDRHLSSCFCTFSIVLPAAVISTTIWASRSFSRIATSSARRAFLRRVPRSNNSPSASSSRASLSNARYAEAFFSIAGSRTQRSRSAVSDVRRPDAALPKTPTAHLRKETAFCKTLWTRARMSSSRRSSRGRSASARATSARIAAAPSEAGAPIGAHAAAASSSSSSRKKPPLTSGRCWRPCAARRSGVSHAEPLGFRPRCGCSL